jgi:site-specific recombinase XerC
MAKRNLPKYVSFKAQTKGYYYQQTDASGKRRQVRIGDEHATDQELAEAVLALQPASAGTVAWLLDTYLQSEGFNNLMPSTQEDYRLYAKTLTNWPIEGGVFGEVKLEDITKLTIRQWMDSHTAMVKKKRGKATGVAANRHIMFFKAAWNYLEEREPIPENPMLRLRLNKEKPRERYIEDHEYQAVFEMACPELQQVMELAYLCRLRLSEVLKLTHDNVGQTGLRIERSKKSEGEITAWNQRLRLAALPDLTQEQMRERGERLCHYELKDKRVSSAFRSAWARLWRRVKKEHPEMEPYTFHDIKAKGISDHNDEVGGHRSEQMRKVYVRKLKEVEATAGGRDDLGPPKLTVLQ